MSLKVGKTENQELPGNLPNIEKLFGPTFDVFLIGKKRLSVHCIVEFALKS